MARSHNRVFTQTHPASREQSRLTKGQSHSSRPLMVFQYQKIQKVYFNQYDMLVGQILLAIAILLVKLGHEAYLDA